jgi:hypothetical protein
MSSARQIAQAQSAIAQHISSGLPGFCVKCKQKHPCLTKRIAAARLRDAQVLPVRASHVDWHERPPNPVSTIPLVIIVQRGGSEK